MSGIVGGAGSKSGVIGETELDYEEGTWTVAIDNGVLDAGSASLVSGAGTQGGNTGYYTKIGNLVYLNCPLKVSAMSGASGSVYMNLPFTATNQFHSLSVYSHSTYDSPHGVQARINFNTATMMVGEWASNGTAADFAQHLQNNTTFDLTGSYRTEA